MKKMNIFPLLTCVFRIRFVIFVSKSDINFSNGTPQRAIILSSLATISMTDGSRAVWMASGKIIFWKCKHRSYILLK